MNKKGEGNKVKVILFFSVFIFVRFYGNSVSERTKRGYQQFLEFFEIPGGAS